MSDGGIGKSVLRIAVWHHEACRVMTNGDAVGRIFLPHPHPNNGIFFLLTIKYRILCFKIGSQTESPEYIEMPHVMMTSL